MFSAFYSSSAILKVLVLVTENGMSKTLKFYNDYIELILINNLQISVYLATALCEVHSCV